MAIIPWKISNEEIIVRIISNSDFRKKVINKDRLDRSNCFHPYKGGVSMQRGNYCDENCCKAYGMRIGGNRYFVGFLIFDVATFNSVKEHYIKNSRSEFKAELKATPLDEDFIKYPESTSIETAFPGNPYHCDLEYTNPAPKEEETPKSAIRSFAKKLGDKCYFLIDENGVNSNEYEGQTFNDAF